MVFFGDTSLTWFRNTGSRYNPVWQWEEAPLFPGVGRVIRSGQIGALDGLGRRGAVLVFQDDPSALWRARGSGNAPDFNWVLDAGPLEEIDLPWDDFYGPPQVVLSDTDGDGMEDLLVAAMAADPGHPGRTVIRVYRCAAVACPEGSCWSAGTLWAAVHSPDYALTPDTALEGFQAVDLDGDGDEDLVFSGTFDSGDELLLGLASVRQSGPAAAPTWSALRYSFLHQGHPDLFGLPDVETRSMGFADVDADGDADLFTYAGFHRNAGTHQQPAFPGPGEPDFLTLQHGQVSKPVLEDIDRDGAPDLLLSSPDLASFLGSVAYYRNEGRGFALAFAAGDPDFQGWVTDRAPFLRFADLDGNGYREAWLGSETGLKAALRDAGGWQAPLSATAPATLRNLDCRHGFDWGELDGDGRLDFLLATLAGGVQVLRQEPGGAFTATTQDLAGLRAAFPEGNLRSPVLRDLDRDGLPDLAALLTQSASPTGELVVAYGTVAGFAPPSVAFAFHRAGGSAIDLADIDGDGDADLFAGTLNGGVQLFLNPLPHLAFARDRLTVQTSAPAALAVTNATGAVTWRILANTSGATLDSGTGQYTAGPTPGLDAVEAVDAAGTRGRVYLNVIQPADVSATGRALLVAGAKSGLDPVWAATDRMAARAYEVLRLKGYAKENIVYLSFDPQRDLDGDGALDDIDGEATLANLRAAFTNLLTGTDRLLVHLVDHGSTNTTEAFLRLSPGELLPAAELRGLLDDFQTETGAGVTLVADFCYAGEFTRRLANSNRADRLLLASCAPGELAHFIARGLVSYSDLFFTSLLAGADALTAHNLARGAMSEYQQAWLDDNGDGVSDPDADGALAAGRRIGADGTAGRDLPQIGRISPNQEVDRDQPVRIWAQDVAGPFPLARVWAVVVPPGGITDPSDGNPVVDLPEVELIFDPQTRRHEAEVRGLRQPGVYKVMVFARDVWGGVSFPRQSVLRQAGYVEKAVLAHGGGPGDAPAAIAAEVQRTLRARLFAPEHIRWLGAGPVDAGGDGTNDVHGAATPAELEDAITTWAADADKLVVFLIGGATSNRFSLGTPLDPADLDAWLDQQRASDTGRVQTVVLDHEGAGASIAALTATGRVVLAAAEANRPVVHQPGASFSSFLSAGIAIGRPVGEAARTAARATRRYSGNLRQKMRVDDDGDGVPNRKRQDLLFADRQRIGAAFLTGDDLPGIASVVPEQVLTNATSVLVWADGVTDADGIARVWVDVSTPTNWAGAVSERVELAHVPGTTRWEGLYTSLSRAGVHTLGFQAMDGVSNLSAVVQSRVVLALDEGFAREHPELPDPFEPDPDCATTPALDLPMLHTHSLHTTGDVDTVVFYASAEGVYDIETVPLSGTLDTVLEIYRVLPDGGLEQVDLIDEAGAEDGELGGLDFPSAGFYCVRVSHAAGEPFDPGAYLLMIHIPRGFTGINVTARLVGETRARTGVTTDDFTLLDSKIDLYPPQVITPSSVPLASKMMTTSGVVKFEVPIGNYYILVTPPTGYFPLFNPTNASQVASNRFSTYGNARALKPEGFGKVTTGEDAGGIASYLGFYFFPAVVVTGRVAAATTREPVAGVRLSLRRHSDNVVLDRYPWGAYGTPFQTSGAGIFPPRLRVPVSSTYTLTLERSGYSNRTEVVQAPASGVLDLSRILLHDLDTDRDGLPDAWEQAHFGTLAQTAAGNSDGDAFTNAQEFQAGTHPADALSRFALHLERLPAGTLRVSGAGAGRHYRLYGGPDPAGPWELLVESHFAPFPSYTEPPSVPIRFYRAEASFPP